MSQWRNIAPVAALSIAAFAGTGCMAETANDESTDEPDVVAVPEQAESDEVMGDERTGEADQAWFGRWGGFGRRGGFGFGRWGGFGFGRWGFGSPFFGGYPYYGFSYPFFGGYPYYGFGCGFGYPCY